MTSVTPVPTAKLAKSMNSRRPCANSRVSTEAGTQAMPSITTEMHRTRRTFSASGEPRTSAMGFAATNNTAYSAPLNPADKVRTVGANSRTSRVHRISARLTPISLADSSTLRATMPVAYRPQSRGESSPRARMMPVANVPTRMMTVFSRLQRTARLTLVPSSGSSASAARRRRRRAASEAGRGWATTRPWASGLRRRGSHGGSSCSHRCMRTVGRSS